MKYYLIINDYDGTGYWYLHGVWDEKDKYKLNEMVSKLNCSYKIIKGDLVEKHSERMDEEENDYDYERSDYYYDGLDEGDLM